MSERLNTGVVMEASLLQALDTWAKEEYRSRNSLINQILARAVNNKRGYPATVDAPADADMDTRDAEQLAALAEANRATRA